MSNYRTPFGFPVRYKQESGLHIENGFLFGIYEYMFTQGQILLERLTKYYYQAKQKGFPNHIVDSVPEKQLSHDQATAYSCFSYMFGLDGHLRIWMKIQKGKLDGVLLHPRDLIYYGILNGHLLSILSIPLLWVLCAFSMFIPYRITKDPVDRPDQIKRIGKYIIRKKLSGELLWVLRVEAVKKNIGLKLLLYPCQLIVNLGARLRYGSIENMFIEYFQNDPNHPIVKVLKNR